MVEATRSASRSTALSGTKQKTQKPFDVRSWQGLTEILQTARSAGFSDSEYAKLRDTILQYAQSGGNEELRKEIDAAVSQLQSLHTATPTDAEPKTTKTEERRGNPSVEERPTAKPPMQHAGRPAPQFLVRKETDSSKIDAPAQTQGNAERASATPPPRKDTVKEKEPSAAKPEPPTAPHNLPVGTMPRTEERTQAVPPAPQEIPSRQVEVVQEPPAEPASLPKPQPAPPPPPAPPAQPAAGILETQPAPIRTLEDHKRRIAEIKHEVNAKVGNPVILVEAGNELGKEYMNALLAAMKASAGGYSGSLDVAMARLEKAAELVLTQPAAVTPPPKEEPAAKKEKEGNVLSVEAERKVVQKEEVTEGKLKEEPPIAQQPPESPSPPPPTPQKEIPPKPPTPPPVKKPPLKPEPEEERTTKDTPSPQPKPEPKIPLRTDLPEQSKRAVLSVDERKPEKQTEPEELKTAPKTPITYPKAHAGDGVKPSGTKVHLPLPDMSRYVKYDAESKPIPQVPNQTEISSPEVTAGLNHLLSEWSLFKSSGVLGMGSRGIEHPLYKQLSQLSMFAVIAGRWEHASPKVTQSIKDYTNAWRHEQGIMYTPGETFEHYLRRVVLRILKRQNS